MNPSAVPSVSSLPRVHHTVVHMLRDTVASFSAREALICGSERLSYAEYQHCVDSLASELVALGATGERVALILANSCDLCIALFAIHAARAQAVPLNPIYPIRELEPLLADAAPSVLLYSEQLETLLAPLCASLGVQNRIAVGTGESGPGRRLCRPNRSASATGPAPEPAELAMLQYTGGTTGRSKGAELTHHAISTNISQREALLPMSRDGERILCVMPLFHTYAIAMCLHNAAYCGGTLVIVPRFTPQAVFEVLERERISIFAGSPTVFTGLMSHELFVAERVKGLRMSYSGSAPLPAPLLAKWEEATGAPVLEGYGLSEAGPVVAFNPLNGPRKPQSVGRPLPCTAIEIVDVNERERVLGACERGEIRVRGPQLMRGYRNRPEESAEALRDGWLYTGDIGELDNDGYLYIRDRKKDMLLVSGYNVYPREVEEVLYSHALIQEAAVIGAADAYRGSLVKAYVVLRDRASITTGELDEFCRLRLAPYKVPRSYVFVSNLPRTSVGKIDKKRLE